MNNISIYDFKINFELLNNSKSGKIYLFKDKFYLTWSLNFVENKFEFLSESWFSEEEKRLISFEYWIKVSNPYVGNSLKFREEEKLRKMDLYKKNQEEFKFFSSFISIFNLFFKNISFYDIDFSKKDLFLFKNESFLFLNNYKRKEKENSSNLKQLNKKVAEVVSYNKVTDFQQITQYYYSFFFFDKFLGDEYYKNNFKFLYKDSKIKLNNSTETKILFNFFKFNSSKKTFISEWSVPKEYNIKEKGFFFFIRNSKKFYRVSLLSFFDFLKKKFVKIDTIGLYKDVISYNEKGYLLKKLLYTMYSGNQRFDWKNYFFLEDNSNIDENVNYLDEEDLLDMEDNDIEEISSIYFKLFFFKNLYYDYISIINQQMFKELSENISKELNQIFDYKNDSINIFYIKLLRKDIKDSFDFLKYYKNIFFSKKSNKNVSEKYMQDLYIGKEISINILDLLKNEENSFNLNNEFLNLLDLVQNSQKEYIYNSLDLLKEQGNVKKHMAYLFFLKKYYSLSLLFHLTKNSNYENIIYNHTFSKNLYNYYNLYNEIIIGDFLRQRLVKNNYKYDSINSYDLKYNLNKSDSKFFKYSIDIYTKVAKSDGSFTFKNQDSMFNNQILLFKFLSYLKGVLGIIKIL